MAKIGISFPLLVQDVCKSSNFFPVFDSPSVIRMMAEIYRPESCCMISSIPLMAGVYISVPPAASRAVIFCNNAESESWALPLTCQRTLEVFDLPVQIDSRLGLITREEDEAGLPAGYEPLLTADGALRLADVVEDELILAVPVVPVKPGTEHVEQSWGGNPEDIETPAKPNPFTALKQMKISR